MSALAFHVLVLAGAVPDLSNSPFGPFELHHCDQVDALDARLNEQRFDALILGSADHASLEHWLHWPGLPRAVLETAVVVVGEAPAVDDGLKLLHAGVRDVWSHAMLSAPSLGMTLRWVIERKRLDDMARRAYSIDLATGLPNHQQLVEHMTHLLALREREPAPMALVVLQLDGLAALEASQGRETANVLRRKVAVRLRATLRASDVVASLGQDVFGVLLAWLDDDEAAHGVAKKLVLAASTPITVAGQAMPMGARYGLSQFPIHGKTAQELLRRAVAQVAQGGLGRLSDMGSAANDDA